MKWLLSILIALLAGAVGAWALYTFAPQSVFSINGSTEPSFGSTVTTINGSDTLSSSRSVINTNFSNLNTGKFELSDWYATTSAAQLTTLANLATVGTITSGTWSGTAIALNKGGTGATSFTTSGAAVYYTGSILATAPTTGPITITYASTTQLTVAGTNFYIDGNGHVTAKDTVNAWSGVVSPTRAFVLSTATTTTWGGTTTPAYVPYLVMPFTGTLRDMRCMATSTQAFLGVAPRINGVKTTPSYTVASTTVGQTIFTSNNTFTAGQRIDIFVGTTTTDTNATGVACTFTATETP